MPATTQSEAMSEPLIRLAIAADVPIVAQLVDDAYRLHRPYWAPARADAR
jgi:hypothetical protein